MLRELLNRQNSMSRPDQLQQKFSLRSQSKVRLELNWWPSNLPKLDLKSPKESFSRKRQVETFSNLLRVVSSFWAQIFHTRLFLRRGWWTRKRKGTLQRRNLSPIIRWMGCQNFCQKKEVLQNCKNHWSHIFATNAILTQIAWRCLKTTIYTNIRNGVPSVISVIRGFSQMNICKITLTQSTIPQLTVVLLALLKPAQKDNW